MNTFTVNDTVGGIVTSFPRLSAAFEHAGLDYCCGGKKTLRQACEERNLDPADVLAQLEAARAGLARRAEEIDPAAMTLGELADHIESTHHAYVRRELPRLDALASKVAAVHGTKDPRLHQLRSVFFAVSSELELHMVKEEEILFPMIRRIERAALSAWQRATLAGPIGVMEKEHDEADAGFRKMRELTNDFTAPDSACNSYRALLDGLAAFEHDLHRHVHKENNVLFPRALASGDGR